MFILCQIHKGEPALPKNLHNFDWGPVSYVCRTQVTDSDNLQVRPLILTDGVR